MLEVSKGKSPVDSSTDNQAVQMLVRKRDGRLVPFHGELIAVAMSKAFCAEAGLIGVSELETELQEKIALMTSEVVAKVEKIAATESGVDVEMVQDEVERELMRHEFFSVARRYILYRESQAKRREQMADDEMVTPTGSTQPAMQVDQ